MAFKDANASEIPTVTIHSGKLRTIDAVIKMQLRSVRHDRYDQFAEIFSSRYLQYPTLPLQFLTSKKSIGLMTLSMRNMNDERGAVLTQSAKVCTHRVRRPPFWLIVTALDRNRSLPVCIDGIEVVAFSENTARIPVLRMSDLHPWLLLHALTRLLHSRWLPRTAS